MLTLAPQNHRLTKRLNNSPTPDFKDLRRRFDRAAQSFDEADFVHRVTRDGLFERLQAMPLAAKRVVDLGCATGSATRALAKRFRGASIVAIDASLPMLAACRAKQAWRSKTSVVQAEATALPLPDQSVDVVFANLLLPWIADPFALAREVARVLQKDGLFAFSTLGPDSLLELRTAWAGIDGGAHVHRFLDMHDVGDAMVRAGLRDPVLDVDRLAVSYGSTEALFRDLTACGGRNTLAGRQASLTGRGRFSAMQEALADTAVDGKMMLDLELVYGHCWGAGQRPDGGDVRIDAGAIPIRRR
jgi:malonyl-CoA O-methyltransferase